MKKIVMLLTNEFDPDVRVYKEAKYLISRGFEVTILCWYRDNSRNYPAKEYIDGIEIIRFDIPSIAGSGKKQIKAFREYILECKKYLKKHPCAYLHCNDIDGAITGFLAGCNKTPMVFDMHEFYEKGKNAERFLWRKLTIFLLRKSIAGLYENAAYLSDDYKSVRNKLFPLRNYPDVSLIQKLPKSDSNVFRIGYHGSVRSQLPEFTALFDAVKDMKDVRVDINGEGPDLAGLIELSKKADNFFSHGPFDGTKVLTELYEKTDVLFCGYSPTSPNFQGDAEVVKFYEAIFTGTPIIMTEKVGMAKKVIKNGFGVICDTRNPEEIRKAVLKLKMDKKFWQECSNNETKHASEYDWNEAVKVLDKIYQEGK